jgi:hypothetical protein
MTRNLYILFFFLAGGAFFSQEGLKPLGSNLNYIYKNLRPQVSEAEKLNVSQQRTQSSSSLFLPFVEDFYYSSTNIYPDQNKWSDSMAYINSGFPIAPPSIGVATFDGLNKHGYPYNSTLVNIAMSLPADTLTSQPINLHLTSSSGTLDPSTSNVALSFYYQARGNGDNPELSDSLIVDFFRPLANPDTAWKRVWFSEGNSSSNTNDSAFKRAFIRVQDSSYFHDGFKFRFRNWASITGNFDHWHVDYIFLDQNRDSIADTVYKDITITEIPTSFLRNYSAMPFQQYDSSEIAKNISVRIRNNGPQAVNMEYRYRIYDSNGMQLSEYQGGPGNLVPFNPYGAPPTSTTPVIHGYSQYPPHAFPPVNYTFTLPPPNSVEFKIKHFVTESTSGSTLSSGDIIPQNDTVIQHQLFRNYYAYDDGSAEAGYYINAVGGKMALKFKLNNLDTLLGIQIYFDPVGNEDIISNPISSVYNFTMIVWAQASNGGPGSVIVKDYATLHPSYIKDGFKEIPELRFQSPLPLSPGTYFFGFQQGSNTITVGYDRNYDYSSNLYYDAGAGWTQSAENGSLMLRPVFGNYRPVVGIPEISPSEKNSFLVYPNPSSDQFIILSYKPGNASYQLFNSLGQLVKEEKIESGEQHVSTSALNAGMYILIFKDKGQAVQQQKIIIQH